MPIRQFNIRAPKIAAALIALALIAVATPLAAARQQNAKQDGLALEFDTAATGLDANAQPEKRPVISTNYSTSATYVQAMEKHRTGPAWERCHQGSAMSSPQNYSRQNFAFRDSSVQAYYWAYTEGFYHDAGYYAENTDVEVVWWDNIFRNTDWDLELRDMQRTATPVNGTGQPIALESALQPKALNGQQVIDMYWKFQSSPIAKKNFCYIGEQAFARRINQADGKKELSYMVYLDTIDDENLVFETTHEYGYGMGPFSQYEPAFTAAGWQKDTARTKADEVVTRVMDAGGPSVQGQGNMR